MSVTIISLGLLICLICLYFLNEVWGTSGYVIGGYGFPIGVIVALVGIFKKDD